MHMRDWISKINAFLALNERDILQNAGKISHEMAKEFAEREYDKFHQNRIEQSVAISSDFDRAIKEIPSKPVARLPGRKTGQ
jgi:hypothetical protein